MTRLGDLERAVMDVLWDSVPGTSDGVTVREVADALDGRELAYTTVMTVLDRLAGKGMVQREREGRAWRYRPAATREAHIAQLMLDALDLGGSRDAALVRFARSVTGTEADVLRAALAAEAGLTDPDRAAGAGRTEPDRAAGARRAGLTDRVEDPRPAGPALDEATDR
ncbi:Predicted transcriptional regulator [Micromonospora sediminicola]|uniref:Predicted transcriptional regulator n=1 Tax=Micromonospora sediminicola TaxID=946078 RepID=A0A1A9BID4_9ACTN|nr:MULTISPECIES: BlaI/MecI/CopY family transcriptional regulator [Micromonospora]PGH43519.1 penicillinase repressor [Micromonospora sp. WMMA1996]SBT68831.1 Predicted transcriptional regulator [Micromonospora sediminicola]